MEPGITFALAFAFVLIGWWLGRRSVMAQHRAALQQIADAQARAEQCASDAARLPDTQERATRAEAANLQMQNDLRAGSGREAELVAKLAEATQRAEKCESDRLASEARRESLQTDLHLQINLTTKAQTERAAALQTATDSREFLAEAQSKLREAFIAAASAVFDDKARLLDTRIADSATTAKTGLEATLKPFSEKVAEFQQRLELMTNSEALERATLIGTIGELKTLNQEMADSTNAMTRALLGNQKVRGDWGEMILESVLVSSGLEEGTHFDAQRSTRDDDTGRQQKPDVVVRLPDGRQIVVDSKVNLVAWAEANQAETADAQNDALIRHAAALRGHMLDLAEKNYPKNLGEHTLDTTVMFVPIEGALSAALSANKALQTEAWGKRIVFASPNTLMAMLRICERLWNRDKMHNQIDRIGKDAGLLLDALIAFLGEFDGVGTKLRDADEAFRQAKNRLQESPQAVIARAKRLVESGAKGKRQIPEDLMPDPGVPVLAFRSDDAPGPDAPA